MIDKHWLQVSVKTSTLTHLTPVGGILTHAWFTINLLSTLSVAAPRLWPTNYLFDQLGPTYYVQREGLLDRESVTISNNDPTGTNEDQRGVNLEVKVK